LPYLDIVYRLNASLNMPIFAYQVSGEYAMLKSAVMNSMLDEKDTVLESLACFKLAGSTWIISYISMQAAKC
ncbi:MAG: porphobilinogen synthase, partial [Burkholderiaceae bacterium]